MPLIAKVEQSGNCVRAYSVGDSFLWSRNGILLNWTSREVTIQEGGNIYIYDYWGNVVS